MRRFLALVVLAVLLAAIQWVPAGGQSTKIDTDAMLRDAVKALIKVQEPGGQWPYEGVYKVNKELPVGYRVGGTSIAATTLMHAAPNDKEARAAVERGLAFVIRELNHPLMEPSTKDAYDVRVWGHAYALEFLLLARQHKIASGPIQAKMIDVWIKNLIDILVIEELNGGGWNYANRKSAASFVTAPVTQALLFAHGQGEKIPPEIFQRARKSLEKNRFETGSFAYSGNAKEPGKGINALPGSVARSAVCETTLMLLGGGDIKEVKKAIDAFHTHWEELEKRRQKPGTHIGDYKVAPYFFYYGHRYCAQAIQMLPEKERAAERERLMKWVMQVRDKDGMWNDRVFERSRNYGTAMVICIMLNDKTPMPPNFTITGK